MKEQAIANRLKSGSRAGALGIAVNGVLALTKLIIGFLSGSVAILADAINNLIDILASVATVLGYKISRKKPDKEHPFGHARAEYLSGLIISLLIIVMAVEFFILSIKRIVNPQIVTYSTLSLILLILAMVVKLGLGLYYKKVAKKIDSQTLHAAALDSFSDIAVTFVAALSFFLSPYTKLPIDGIAGVIVACVISVGGFQSILKIMSTLLGRKPEPHIIDDIVTLVMEEQSVLGVHDIALHDYGPGHLRASIHVEIPAQKSFADAHDAIDRIERRAREELNIEFVIHGDPITADEKSISLRLFVKNLLLEYDGRLGFHDLQIIDRDPGCDVCFDVILPYDFKGSKKDLEDMLVQEILDYDLTFQNILITFDKENEETD